MNRIWAVCVIWQIIVGAAAAYARGIPAQTSAEAGRRTEELGLIQADRSTDGNRRVPGVLPLDEMRNLQLRLPEPATWATGIWTDAGPVWYVRTHSGNAYRVSVVPAGDDLTATELDLPRESGPVILYRSAEGGAWTPGTMRAMPADRLPDAHLAVTRDGAIVYLGLPTGRYAHGVLGDYLEGGALVIVPPLGTSVSVPLDPYVAEERGTLLLDLDGDGGDEIVTILTERSEGAFVAAFSSDGELLVRGPAIGTGFRWRHLIGAGPIGPEGEWLIAVVRTPHIGGVIEYYDADLRIVATAPGYSSHAIGSANLGDAIIADVDGDGRAELIVPTQSRSRLEAVGLSREGPVTVWSHPLPSGLSANLAFAIDPSGRTGSAALLVAERDGTIHVWW